MPIFFITEKCRYKVSGNVIVQRCSLQNRLSKNKFNKIALNEFES